MSHPLFTQTDYKIVRQALGILSNREAKIIILRFWKDRTIEQISQSVGLSWNETDLILQEGLTKLRKFCLMSPEFSRSSPELKAA